MDQRKDSIENAKKNRLLWGLFFSEMYSLGLESNLIVHLITGLSNRICHTGRPWPN